jgi:SAM-dependent methyltransferase
VIVTEQVKSEARYDAIVGWYLPWVGEAAGLLCDERYGWIAPSLLGQRWLDVACGAGRTSRELARRGGEVVGVDVSANFIAVARTEEAKEPLGVNYCVGDIAKEPDWWDGKPFDGAACEMAFMDIDDLGGTVTAVARVLRPGGAFRISMVHPCFPGNENGLSSWPPDGGYEAEGFWTSPEHNPEGVRLRVGSSHRTLSTYLNVLLDAGFVLEHLSEPSARVPTYLLLALQRAD